MDCGIHPWINIELDSAEKIQTETKYWVEIIASP